MKLKGKVKSGFGEGAYFMTREVYLKQFKDKLGFEPFPGTLNIQINEHLDLIDKIKKSADIIHGGGVFGDVLFVRAVLNDKIHGAILFPVKGHHQKGCVEFVAPVSIRKTLKLRDEDTVSLKITLD